ncbi:MAG: hypothetical protein ACOC3D_00525 [Pseudomonadota bacterium]
MAFVSRMTLLSTLARRLEACFAAHELADRALDPARLHSLITARIQASRALVEARRALAELPASQAAAPEPLATTVAAALEGLQVELFALRDERAALAAALSHMQATVVEGDEPKLPATVAWAARNGSVRTG